jgi:hypothetical protein
MLIQRMGKSRYSMAPLEPRRPSFVLVLWGQLLRVVAFFMSR